MGRTRAQDKSTPYQTVKRSLDLLVVLLSLPLVLPLALCVAIAVKLTSPGPTLYWSDRIGADGRQFRMPKFRTMRVGTPALATHLLPDPSSVLTPIGGFLRTASLDEIPQLWSILSGDMTLVGPRPALYNQDDLIALRAQLGVDKLVPGLTGLAQIRGRDDLPIQKKVSFDREYLESYSLWVDIKILARTLINVFLREGISH